MTKKLSAVYAITSVFDIPPDIDLDKVYDWWIKYDTLYIREKEEADAFVNGEWVATILEIQPRYQGEDHGNFEEPDKIVDENGKSINNGHVYTLCLNNSTLG